MSPEQEGPEPFDLHFSEVGLVYGVLYSHSLMAMPTADLMDEIERRELFPETRAIIPVALETRANLLADLRAYMVEFAGEAEVTKLETQIQKHLEENH